jgi:hypothetical protein
LTSPSESISTRSPLPLSTDSNSCTPSGLLLQPSGNRPGQAPTSFWPLSAFEAHRPTYMETVRQCPSHGIFSPSALEESEVHSTRVCLARYVPLPGFLTLLGVCSSRNHSVLFHTENAHGVSPSGLFPLDGDGTLSSLVTLLALSTGFPTDRKTVRNQRVGLHEDPRRIYHDLPSSRSPPGFCSPRESVPPTSEC